MRKLFVVSLAIALLNGLAARATSIQENAVFPQEFGVIASQLVDQAPIGIRDIPDPIHANMGQSFTLTNSTTLRAITMKSHSTVTFSTGNDVLELWIGADTDPSSVFVAGATNLLTMVDVGGISFVSGNFYTINLDSDIILPAGEYGFQFTWTSTAASHQWFLKRASSGGDYAGGGLLSGQTTDGSFVDFPFDTTAGTANDLVFGMHSTVVGVQPWASIDPAALDMILVTPETTVNGTVGFYYNSETTMEVAISISDQSHPGSFSVVSATPQTLSNPYPATNMLEFAFDNGVAGLSTGQLATGLVTIAWSETGGGGSGQILMPISTFTGHAPEEDNIFNGSSGAAWDNAANWDLGRVPGSLGADRALIPSAMTVDNSSDFSGIFNWETIVYGASTLNISADFLNAGPLRLGYTPAEYGFVNQSAGDATVTTLDIGDASQTAVSNSVYTLSGGSVTANEFILRSTGLLNIDGGTLTLDASIDPDGILYTAGIGLLKLQSGTFASTSGGKVVIMYNNVEISGGAVALDGQTYFDNEFRVIGDAASISIAALNNHAGFNADYVFEMDSDGISTINVPSWMHLNYATISVDGAAYIGGSRTFTLFSTGNLASTSTVVSVTNFPAGVVAYITQDQTAHEVTLTIDWPGYTGWIGGYGLSGPDAAWDYDYDLDGEVNFYEYALGGDPTNMLVKAYVPAGSVVEDGGTTYYEYTYARRMGVDTGLIYNPLFGTDLVNSNWSGTGVVELPNPGILDATYESVTNRVNTTGKPDGFMELIINSTP